jgi:phage shock protein B
MSDAHLAIWLSLLPASLPVLLIAAAVVIGITWITFHYTYKLFTIRGASRRDTDTTAQMKRDLERLEARVASLEQLLVDSQAPMRRHVETQGEWHGLG